MALSNSLQEALREFTATEQGGVSEAAKDDLSRLEEESQGGLAAAEDCAFGILAGLYGLQEKAAADSGEGADDIGVSKE